MPDGFLAPRFPSVPTAKPHYESMYLTATHPSEQSAFWIRYTVRKPAGGAVTASVWFTHFRPDGVRAGKVTLPVGAQPAVGMTIEGAGSLDPSGARGSLPGVSWDLRFSDGAEPMTHLRRHWMYVSPIPKTKSTSPHPDLRISGTIAVDGTEYALDDWRGMLGHNWGSEHALRWVWLRGSGFAEEPSAWLDVVIGRIKVGPITLPWFANGLLSLDGQRHRVGGAFRLPTILERADGADISLRAPGLRLQAAVSAPLARGVGWEYADPGGDTHQVRNCSVAGMTLTIGDRVLTSDHGCVYELGTHEYDAAVTMQPYPDA
jgi:hypothetical protein